MIAKSEVLVVIPAYNEMATVAQVVRDVQGEGFTVLVIDDGSTDATSVIAHDAGAQVLTLPINVGVGGALRAGFRYAVENNYRAVIQCDADGQHLSMHLPDLLIAANQSSADMVIGSRFKSESQSMKVSATRRLVMRCLAGIATRATKEKITDVTLGFRVITQPLLAEFAGSFPAYYLGDTFEAVVVAGRAGYKVEEIGTTIAPRLIGSSTATSAQSVGMIAKSLILTIFKIHFRIRNKSSHI